MATKEAQYINEKPPAPKPKRPRVNEKPAPKSRSKKAARYADDEPTFIGNWVANTNWPELFRELSGLILLVFGLVVMFSLFSYDPNDKSVNTAGGAVHTNNWIGPVGASFHRQVGQRGPQLDHGRR